jgi:prepilin-type N-terminal cleavage/methylation domain-containing protein
MKKQQNKKHHKNKGFNLVEIIVSIAILAIVFSFVFYFVSSINFKNKNIKNLPYLVKDYNYSNKYCHLKNNQLNNISQIQLIDMSQYISTSTSITSINIYQKNKMIITTNSASTSEKDIFIFDFSIVDDQINLNLVQALEAGPGINDALLHDNFFYVLNTSVNSHVKSFKINTTDSNISQIGDIKINELYTSGALPKKIYLYNKSLFIGTEKNNSGGELFVLPLDSNNIPKNSTSSLEIGGQVSDIYENAGNIYVANASDIELVVYDKDFYPIYFYDAPLSLGNGKSVYFSEPYIYFGRTVASFELFFLEIKDNLLNFLSKNKAYGTVDFIQNIDQNILIISSAESKELQFFTKNLDILKTMDLPFRVSTYNCFENTFLFSGLINNQPNILWLK